MNDVIYLTKDFLPVEHDDPRMHMVKVRKEDGTVVFGYPEGTKQNKLFVQGGPGSGHHGHKGIPGKVGGSLPKGAAGSIATEDLSEEPVETKLESPYRRWSSLGVYPSGNEEDPYDAKSGYDFHDDVYYNVNQRIGERQREAILSYTDGDYTRINRSLRDPSLGYEKMIDNPNYYNTYHQVRQIDSVFEIQQTELPENVVLFRGTTLDHSKRAETIKLLQMAKNPRMRVFYDDPGYFSASTSNYIAKSFGDHAPDDKFNVFFEIQAPKGGRVIPVGEDLISGGTEEEMILPRGSRFEILYYTDDPEDMPSTKYDARIVMRWLP